MQTYVAFLRGINAGVSVKMSTLLDYCTQAGLVNPRTVLATGNIIFETAETDIVGLEAALEEKLCISLAYRTTVIILSKKQMVQVLQAAPFTTPVARTAVPQVTFVKTPPDPDFTYPLQDKGYTLLGRAGRAIYSVVDLTGATTPDLMRRLDQMTKKQNTTRNWNTFLKVASKLTLIP